jgi:hypothetical protein
MAELDSGQEVGHEKVSKWLKSWGKPSETKSPEMKVVRSRRAIRHLVLLSPADF